MSLPTKTARLTLQHNFAAFIMSVANFFYFSQHRGDIGFTTCGHKPLGVLLFIHNFNQQ